MTQQEYIINRFGENHGKLLNARIAEKFSSLRVICIGESKERQKTLREKILPRIAMYRVLQDEMADADAYEAVLDYTKTCICAPMRGQNGRLEKLPFFFSLYRKIFLHIVTTSDKWETKITCDEKDRFGFEIHRCLWNETCVKCGCQELCRVFWDSDYENFGDMKQTAFSRTQTLGTGGTMCDFTLNRRYPSAADGGFGVRYYLRGAGLSFYGQQVHRRLLRDAERTAPAVQAGTHSGGPPALLEYELPEGKFVKYKGRSYCWAAVTPDGVLRLSLETLGFLQLEPGMKLLTIRSSDIAFTMGAKGPLFEREKNYMGEIEVF